MSDLNVKIAEVKIGTDGDILKATLGSCVGIAFIWKEKNLYGLAHCFLPETDEVSNEISARYVNQGIASLMTMMKIKKEDAASIDVYIAGGGNMMNQLMKSNRAQIGKHNADATAKWLAHHGFKVKRSDLGHDCGMKIQVNCSTGEVDFIRLEDLQDITAKAN
jgi:chemotaxis protein CheD